MIYSMKGGMGLDELCVIAEECFGVTKEELRSKNRQEPLASIRAVFAMTGRLDVGLSHQIIASYLVRSRTNIFHYESKHIERMSFTSDAKGNKFHTDKDYYDSYTLLSRKWSIK